MEGLVLLLPHMLLDDVTGFHLQLPPQRRFSYYYVDDS